MFVNVGTCVGFDGCRTVLEVGCKECATLDVGRVARGVEHVWGWAVIVGCPLVEMVRDVERCWIRGSVFKVDNDDLCFMA